MQVIITYDCAIDGEHRAAGEVLEVDTDTATALFIARRAVAAGELPEETGADLTTETAGDLIGKQRRGSK